MALAVVPSDMVPREPTGSGSGGGGSVSKLGVVSTGPLPKMRPGDPDTVAEPPTAVAWPILITHTAEDFLGGGSGGAGGAGGGSTAPGGCRDCGDGSGGASGAPGGGGGSGGGSGAGGGNGGAETATGEPARPPWPLLLLLSVVLGGIVSN